MFDRQKTGHKQKDNNETELRTTDEFEIKLLIAI